MQLRSSACLSRRYVGLTLVEMLVVMALTSLVMWLLAEAFRIALKTLSQARISAQMMEDLSFRVGPTLVNDLTGGYFFTASSGGNNNSSYRLSSITFNTGSQHLAGFFHVKAPSPMFSPAIDDEGYAIYNITNHALHFTAILPPTAHPFGQGEPNTSPSRAAEIAYFLYSPAETPLTPPPPPMSPPPPLINPPTYPQSARLYQLVRRKRLLPVEHINQYINPTTRLPLPPELPAASLNPSYDEIILDNVLSMELKLYVNPTSSPPAYNDKDWPYTYIIEFDTSSPPNHISQVLGLQITIRTCDPKTGTVRQNTWRFAL